MKKEYKVLVLSVVFVFMFSSLAHAMSWEEFMDTYPNDYIYRVEYPTGDVNYLSSPVELRFELIDSYKGKEIKNGKSLRVVPVDSDSTFYKLGMNGSVVSYGGTLGMVVHRDITDQGDRIGFQGNIDIFRWNEQYGFFLPPVSIFLRGLGGVIRTILPVGFGILSVMLLVKLLAVYWKRFVHRSL